MAFDVIDMDGSLREAIKEAILEEIPDAEVEVGGGGGHFTIAVTSPIFKDKRMLDQQRLVYSAITPLMSGENAPVHAIDQLVIRVPDQG